MDLKVEYKLCLNDEVVPTSVDCLLFIDPLDLAGDIDLDLEQHHQVNLVNLQTTGNLRWLEKVFKLPAQSLRKDLHKLPLISQIKKAVEDVKKSIQKTRAPTQWKALTILSIRNRILFVQNRTDCVILGLVDETGDTSLQGVKKTLLWIAEQVQKDLEALQTPAGDGPAGWKRSESWGDREDEIQ